MTSQVDTDNMFTIRFDVCPPIKHWQKTWTYSGCGTLSCYVIASGRTKREATRKLIEWLIEHHNYFAIIDGIETDIPLK